MTVYGQDGKVLIMDNIPHKVNDCGIKLITKVTLKKLCPEAAKALKDQDVDHQDIFWVITEKPQLLSGSEEEGDEEWSQTNEPELAVTLAEEWDVVAVPVGDGKVVLLCGSEDDEYGNFWDNTAKEWSNYSY